VRYPLSARQLLSCAGEPAVPVIIVGLLIERSSKDAQHPLRESNIAPGQFIDQAVKRFTVGHIGRYLGEEIPVIKPRGAGSALMRMLLWTVVGAAIAFAVLLVFNMSQ
jgi:hypothetical protein